MPKPIPASFAAMNDSCWPSNMWAHQLTYSLSPSSLSLSLFSLSLSLFLFFSQLPLLCPSQMGRDSPVCSQHVKQLAIVSFLWPSSNQSESSQSPRSALGSDLTVVPWHTWQCQPATLSLSLSIQLNPRLAVPLRSHTCKKKQTKNEAFVIARGGPGGCVCVCS